MQHSTSRSGKGPGRREPNRDRTKGKNRNGQRNHPAREGYRPVQKGFQRGKPVRFRPDTEKPAPEEQVMSGKTPVEMQRMSAIHLMKSIANLGPGAGVWTRVSSMLTSEVPVHPVPSICNGFADIDIEWTLEQPAGRERMVERIRWYEHD